MHFALKDEEELRYNNNDTIKLNLPSITEVVTSNLTNVEIYPNIFNDGFERPNVDHANIEAQNGNFRMTELTEVIRKRGDNNLISLLNKIWEEEIDSNVEKALISRFVNKNYLSYTTHSVHIFDENSPVGEHNRERLNQLKVQSCKFKKH